MLELLTAKPPVIIVSPAAAAAEWFVEYAVLAAALFFADLCFCLPSLCFKQSPRLLRGSLHLSFL